MITKYKNPTVTSFTPLQLWKVTTLSIETCIWPLRELEVMEYFLA